ncbi:MAG: CoA transferase [Dehalococcoidia bacterium]|jgi:benzylsuccinate CoA-transferase BbsF subunit|nr:CoA transferase [Dehalococcoidia bacterium]MDP7085059.1 CoA transferase [Dehalococcoidia bacterium]MDP7201989.1 CoA transferase [Dehalococcoidia bacterium]HJN85581.1 CoA transferase [Dehalococcoidia bacterium]
MPQNGVLAGVRVLSLEQVHALPWGTSYLADLGAQVIRIESVAHLQDRKAGPFPEGRAGAEWWNEGGNLAYYGTRNKQSLCLDVTDPRGKEVFLKLAQNCDIVTDNFRPGTMHRFGFDHDSLAGLNSRIITLSCTAYGYTGPWRRAGSRARTVDAACGLSYLTGYEDGPSQRASNNYMDHSTGNNIAYALLLALYQRNKTGQGTRVDLTMLETGVSAIGPAILEAQRGISRSRLGCGHLWKSPHNVFPCRGQDRWITIVVSTDEQWRRLKQAMGDPPWAADPRFDAVASRWRHRHELGELLGKWTETQDDQELMHHLQGHGMAAGAVLTAEDLVANPHLRERGYLEEFENVNAPHAGPRTYAGRPFRMPGVPLAIRHVASLGEHNEALLRELANLTDSEIASLADQGIISSRPLPNEAPP